MGVTRIRYLLDQWRLRSVAVAKLQASLEKERETPPWIVRTTEPLEKPRSDDTRPASP